MTKWFRWHEGTTEDGKFRVTARNAGVTVRDVIALWACILEDASKDDHRGICTRDAGFMAAILDFDGETVERVLTDMERVGMVAIEAPNIRVCRWRERQFETDRRDNTNAERQRRFRQKHHPDTPNGGDTPPTRPRNGDVTATKSPETETETETETEKKQEHPPSQASGGVVVKMALRKNEAPNYTDDFQTVWEHYRAFGGEKNSSKKDSFRFWQRLAEIDKDACFQGLVRYGLDLMEKRKRRPDHPAKHLETFINGRGWEAWLEEDVA